MRANFPQPRTFFLFRLFYSPKIDAYTGPVLIEWRAHFNFANGFAGCAGNWRRWRRMERRRRYGLARTIEGHICIITPNYKQTHTHSTAHIIPSGAGNKMSIRMYQSPFVLFALALPAAARPICIQRSAFQSPSYLFFFSRFYSNTPWTCNNTKSVCCVYSTRCLYIVLNENGIMYLCTFSVFTNVSKQLQTLRHEA